MVAGGQEMPAGMTRVAGVDEGSGIQYALVSLDGKVAGPEQPAIAPKLTAQCTRDKAGKLRFELLVDEGGVPAVKYFAPFKTSSDHPFAPAVNAVTGVVMEYVGYVKEKPVKRQWDRLNGMPEELRYATPGMSSKNLEDVARVLQYLRSLPGLRVTIPGRPMLTFETAGWQARVKAEPLCGGSGL